MRIVNPFFPGEYYHIYNHAVGFDNLCQEKIDFQVLMRRMEYYVLPVADLFCYNFLPNHFHLFARIKPLATLQEHLHVVKSKTLLDKLNPPYTEFVSEQFGNWCNSYAKYYNLKYVRKGKLFIDNLKRKTVDSDTYFSKIVHYIHANAVQHGIVNKIEDWPYSSFACFYNSHNHWLRKDEVLRWFGGLEGFSRFHEQDIFFREKHPEG